MTFYNINFESYLASINLEIWITINRLCNTTSPAEHVRYFLSFFFKTLRPSIHPRRCNRRRCNRLDRRRWRLDRRWHSDQHFHP